MIGNRSKSQFKTINQNQNSIKLKECCIKYLLLLAAYSVLYISANSNDALIPQNMYKTHFISGSMLIVQHVRLVQQYVIVNAFLLNFGCKCDITH